MKIINLNRNLVLAEKAILANSFSARLKGLLGFKSLKQDQAMVLSPCNSVHTFFMHFPIDVLFVDKDNRVIEMVQDMKPFRAVAVCFRSEFVVELPSGVIDSTDTSIGDILQIQ